MVCVAGRQPEICALTHTFRHTDMRKNLPLSRRYGHKRENEICVLRTAGAHFVFDENARSESERPQRTLSVVEFVVSVLRRKSFVTLRMCIRIVPRCEVGFFVCVSLSCICGE